MVHRPTRVGTVGSCIAFEEDSPGDFHLFLQEEHSSNAGPTRADLMFRWSTLSGSEGFCLGSMVTWQTLVKSEPDRVNHLCKAWMFPGGDLGYSSCMQ